MTLETESRKPTADRSGGQRPAGMGAMGYGLAAVTMWGLAPVATRAAVADIAPLSLAVLRALMAGLVLLPWAASTFRRLDRGGTIRVIVAGVLGIVGYNLPVALGIQWIPATIAALVLATEPVWIMAMARIFLGERAPQWAWIGAAIALGGVAIIAGPDVLHAGSGGHALQGIALVMLGTLLFGAYTVVLRPLSAAYGARNATAASTVAGAVPYLALVGFLSLHQLPSLPAATWYEVLFLAFGSTVVGMLLWNLSVVGMGSTQAGLLLFLEPIVGVTGGLAFLREHLTMSEGLGGAVVIGGVIIAWTAEGRVAQAS